MSYAVTSNHIHLLVVGNNERDVIPNSIKLIAGRTAQEFNQRKKQAAPVVTRAWLDQRSNLKVFAFSGAMPGPYPDTFPKPAFTAIC